MYLIQRGSHIYTFNYMKMMFAKSRSSMGDLTERIQPCLFITHHIKILLDSSLLGRHAIVVYGFHVWPFIY